METARLLAQLNIAMADSMIGCWDAKYTYVSWRPITAITLADTNENPGTVPELAWTPLLVSAIPGIPVSHSCASGAAARILSRYFGEETPITVTSDALPGQALGNSVGDYVMEHSLRRIEGWRDRPRLDRDH